MLISKIPENEEGKGESAAPSEEDSDLHEYQTANELFELMAKNQNFDSSDIDKLTPRDLVLLYKNIDLGTKLMSNANELERKKPNQHVECIVYNDEPESEGSDVSDVFSNEDMRNVIDVNKERLDLFNTPRSVENTLCHKLGDLQIQTSDLTTDYGKNFLLRDSYIKDQLKQLNFMNKSSDIGDSVLPASLLDYICCKRLEDNYNFYMDNIIRYVKNTIDQLERISNGDYLTDKAKEKWREVETTAQDRLHVNTKVLAASTSIPLHVEQKISGQNTTWDDIVHSAVDIRSISKILEKRIVVEVPKLLCGPYKLFSKCCAENVIIRCKNDKQSAEERVDVVVQLQRSKAGQVISKISSIMILQTTPVNDALGPHMLPLPLPYKQQSNDKQSTENKPKIIELEPATIDETIHEVSVNSECSECPSNIPFEYSFRDNIDFESSENDVTTSLKDYLVSTEADDSSKDNLDEKLQIVQTEISSEVFSDDLRMTIQKLTMQSALEEESGEEITLSQSTARKKKSPTRPRIKSPYENQSHIMEEKKRRRLLEIRERREKKKMALAENCKITKHKYAKGAPLPQSASSVTKLSISNKSFYNSIYGQSMNIDSSKQVKGRNQKGVKREVLEINIENEGKNDASVPTADIDSRKYTNRSYYLDDADTEMMYLNMKRNEKDAKDPCSASTSVSNEFRNNLNYLSQLVGPSETDFNIDDDEIFPDKFKLLCASRVNDTKDNTPKDLLTSQSKSNKVSINIPNPDEQGNIEPNKGRKGIDETYTLTNKFNKIQETENKPTINSKSKDGRMGSTCQGSESGSSLKHRGTLSNCSTFRFNKNDTENPNKSRNKKPGSLSPVLPKVIISSKTFAKTDSDKNRAKDLKSSGNSPINKGSENPLKALSNLLQEFDKIQKARPKTNTKKVDTLTSDSKDGPRKSYIRRSRLDEHNDGQTERTVSVPTPKEKKSIQYKEINIVPKVPYQQIPVDDKSTDKLTKKKVMDILDEAKEARGEAVRGPSKLNARLNSLAQPKKSYVQAHSEEYQTKKYGKSLVAHRLHKLAATQSVPSDRMAGSANNKVKRRGSEVVPAAVVKPRSPTAPSSLAAAAPRPHSPVPPSEPTLRTRRRVSNSPEAKERLMQVMGSPYKQVSVPPETPQTSKKKTVEFESHVKYNCGCATPCSQISSEHHNPTKSRVPLLPNDIELASSTSSAPFQESKELGSRLHNIISSIMKTTSSGLEVLTECQESIPFAKNESVAVRPASDSDFGLDVLDDNNVITTVGNIPNENDQKQTIFENAASIEPELLPVQSVAELEKLQNALCSYVPAGCFQKRLRIKNLTITPKQSLQPVFVLQAGDASSLVVKTPIAQTQNMNEKNIETLFDLTGMPLLSKPHLDWRFANIPQQISTIGYAFPDRKSVKRFTSLVQLFDGVPKKSQEEKISKDAKCGPQIGFEQAAQFDVLNPDTLFTVGKSSTHIHNTESENKQEIKQVDATITEPELAMIDFNTNTVDDKLIGERQAQTHTLNVKNEKVTVEDNSDNLEYTTSLDILVGLLDEIQKITTCQTQITKDDRELDQQSKVLETILINEAATLENSKSSPYDVVSLTSLERLRQLESNPSLYSFYLSDIETSALTEIIPMYTNDLYYPKRIYVDKNVGEELAREAVNKFTDVPSDIFPPVTSNSTTMTNSLIRAFSQPSAESIFSFAECPSVHSSAASIDHKSITNIPHLLITTECKQSLDVYDVPNQTVESPIENKPLPVVIESFEKKKIKKRRKISTGKCRFKTDFDPIMKIKRDVLVTVYSLLVFTVFAALSFPEMFYRI